MNATQSDWNGKSCVVTGGTGFIGSHLCGALYDLGAKVINVDNELPYEGTCFSIVNRSRQIRTIRINLSGAGAEEAITRLEPEVIFHLCGSPYAPYTDIYREDAFLKNVWSTFTMLAAATSLKAKFVLASSACVFGAATSSPLKLEDAPSPAEHYYTITKQLAEAKVEQCRKKNIDAVICRMVNVYGPGDRHLGRIVPQMCLQLMDGDERRLWLRRSDGKSVFEFLHVEDAVSGLLRAGEVTGAKAGVFHLGPGERSRTRILDLAAAMSKEFGCSARKVIGHTNRPEKTVRKFLDLSETLGALGWRAKRELDEGLSETIGWYHDHLRHLKAHWH